jgi:hypothetical protein
MDLIQFRQKYPQYNHVDDSTLTDALHQKFYPHVDKNLFYDKFLPAQRVQQETDKSLEQSVIGALHPEGAGIVDETKRNIGQRFTDSVLGQSGERFYQMPSREEQTDKLIKTLGRPVIEGLTGFVRGRLLGAPDLGWALIKKVLPEDQFDLVKDKNLEQAIDMAMGSDKSGLEKLVSGISEMAGGLATMGKLIPGGQSVTGKIASGAGRFGTLGAIREGVSAASQSIDGDANYGYDGLGQSAKRVGLDTLLGGILGASSSIPGQSVGREVSRRGVASIGMAGTTAAYGGSMDEILQAATLPLVFGAVGYLKGRKAFTQYQKSLGARYEQSLNKTVQFAKSNPNPTGYKPYDEMLRSFNGDNNALAKSLQKNGKSFIDGVLAAEKQAYLYKGKNAPYTYQDISNELMNNIYKDGMNHAGKTKVTGHAKKQTFLPKPDAVVSPEMLNSPAKQSQLTGKPQQRIAPRSKATTMSPAEFVKTQPANARSLAKKDAPSRKDFANIGLEKSSAAERAKFVDEVKSLLSGKKEMPASPMPAREDFGLNENDSSVENKKRKLIAYGQSLVEKSQTPEGIKQQSVIADEIDKIEKQIDALDEVASSVVGIANPKYIDKKLSQAGIDVSGYNTREGKIYAAHGYGDWYNKGLQADENDIDALRQEASRGGEYALDALNAGMAEAGILPQEISPLTDKPVEPIEEKKLVEPKKEKKPQPVKQQSSTQEQKLKEVTEKPRESEPEQASRQPDSPEPILEGDEDVFREQNELWRKQLRDGEIDETKYGRRISQFKTLPLSKEKKAQRKKEDAFYDKYSQHIDIRARKTGKAAENSESIMRDGFKRDSISFGNTMPAQRGGTPGDVVSEKYGVQRGDTVYLVPNDQVDKKTSNVKEGWKPKPEEIVKIRYDYQPLYEAHQERLKELENTEQKPDTHDPNKVVEYPVDKIILFDDLQNFKEGANERGVVEGDELEGNYERLGTGNIVLWERLDGRVGVITGRHRFAHAVDTGEKTIPAQIVREKDGWTLGKALTLDAESNIRDGNGKVKDYARYFRHTETTETEARERGLLSRVKGQVGFRIGRSASDDVFDAYDSGKLTEAKAYSIATGAPNNSNAQSLALDKAKEMSPEELLRFSQIMNLAKPSEEAKKKATSSNLFGFDDSAIVEAEAVAKEVAKEVKSLKGKILSVKGALRRPEIAKKMGLEFGDKEAVEKKVEELENRIYDLGQVSTNPKLYREMKRRAGLIPEEEQSDREKAVARKQAKEAEATKSSRQEAIERKRAKELSALGTGKTTGRRAIIEQALSEGKPVPAEVLKDYPELQDKPESRLDKLKPIGMIATSNGETYVKQDGTWFKVKSDGSGNPVANEESIRNLDTAIGTKVDDSLDGQAKSFLLEHGNTAWMPEKIREEYDKITAAKEKVEGKPILKGGSAGSGTAAYMPGTLDGPVEGYGRVKTSEDADKPKKSARASREARLEMPKNKKSLNVMKDIMSLASPADASKLAKFGSLILRWQLAVMAQKDIAAKSVLEKAHKAFRRLSYDDMLEFIDDLENGRPQRYRELNAIAKIFRELLDERRDAIIRLGKGYLRLFYENYFPHMWKHPDQVKEYMRRRSLQGAKGFLKRRYHMTIKEGIEAGLELSHKNPVDVMLIKLHEMDRFIMAQRTLQDLKDNKLTKFVDATDKDVPPGYSKVDDHLFRVFGPSKVQVKEYSDAHLVSQMLKFAKKIGVKTERYTKLKGKKGTTLGFAEKETGRVVTKGATPETVLIHEIGHQIGFKYHVYDTITQKGKGEYREITRGKNKGKTKFVHDKKARELRRDINPQWRALADLRFEGMEASDSYKSYVRNKYEKEAVIFDAYINIPKKFQKIAPDLYREFDKFIKSNPDLRDAADIERSMVWGGNPMDVEIDGLVIKGEFVVPDEIAKIINNYLSPGLRRAENKSGRLLFRALRGVGNAMNQAQLSLSMFHGFNVTTDIVQTLTGEAMLKISRKGHRLEGAKDLAKTPYDAIKVLIDGKELKKAYRTPLDKITDPKLKMMVEMIIKGGGRGVMDSVYYNQANKALAKTFEQIQKGTKAEMAKAAVKLPYQLVLSGLETVSYPLMQWYIPSLKLGIYAKMVNNDMERLNRGEITETQFMYQINRAWDSVENRMGQLTYDNLFWNGYIKDVSMLAVRSVGWNLGSWREFPGSIADIATTKRRKEMGDSILSRKQAYVISAAFNYALLGAIVQYVLTGMLPDDWKDYFFPKTGQDNPDGSPERLSLPTYAKDIFGYAINTKSTMKHKLHPIWAMITNTLSNKDYFGTEIRDKNDPYVTQAKDVVEYISENFLPFTVNNFIKLQETGGDTKTNFITSALGISPSPNYISRTRAQKLMYRYVAENVPDFTRSKEESERYTYRKNFINNIRTGKPVDMKEASGVLGYNGAKDAFKRAKSDPFVYTFKRLSLRQGLNVYAVANDDEKKKIKPIIVGKYQNRRTPITEDEQALFKELVLKPKK